MMQSIVFEKSIFKFKINKTTPEGIYAGCVGVGKNYVEWHWKVEQCINKKCV